MKKILIITISLIILFGFWQNAAGLLLDYPTIKGTTPTSEGLPGLIRYIYLFALGAVGMVALLSILIGAIKYVTSAGSSDKVKDAKDQITSALLGVLILLASSLILQTINPDLINLGVELPIIKPIIKKEAISEARGYGCYCCYTKDCNPLNPLGTQWSCYLDRTYIEALGMCGLECQRISTSKYLKPGVLEVSCPSKTPNY